jgi:hypothetical protein
MPVSSKRFVISTSGLNSQGFRMLTNGAVLDGFTKNPVLLFNHIRPEGNLKNQILPLGHWQDLKVEGDEISAVPFFDDKDEFAMSIFNKVEGGHIRMCSAGAKPLEISENKKDMLPDQEAPTVTKWELQEASLCDIGANPDSLGVALYDADNKRITLSDKSIKNLTKKNIMNKKTTDALTALKKVKQLTADVTKARTLAAEKVELALADDTISEEDATKLSDEADENKEMSDDDKDKKIDELTKKLAEVQKQLADMQDEKALADQTNAEDKACKLAELGVAQKKITLAQKPAFLKLAKTDYKAAKEMLDSTRSSVPVRELLGERGEVKTQDQARLETLSAKSYDELFKEQGALDFIRLNAPETYKTKFKDKFGKLPKNV